MLRIGALVLTSLVTTACITVAGSAATWSASRPGVAPPSLTTACGSAAELTARALWLTTDDRVRLYAVDAGNGKTGVILAHQGGSDLCAELPYAKTLLDAGFRVLAFDFRGNGLSARSGKNALDYRRDFTAAIGQLHSDGATRVFLIGASMGAAAAVQNSGGLPLAGVVSLSGTRLWPGYGINRPGPRALRAPFLYIGSKDDRRAPLEEARAVVRHVGARDKRSIFYRGSLHGWELVQDAIFAAKTRALILTWIREHA